MILIQLQTAFDTLVQDILLDKMKYLGFTSKTRDWFRTQLKMFVKAKMFVSFEKTIRKQEF